MKKTVIMLLLFMTGTSLSAQNNQDKSLNTIICGIHPDDSDSKYRENTALCANLGHEVKFVALTNGDAGHQGQGGESLGKSRGAEVNKIRSTLSIVHNGRVNQDRDLEQSIAAKSQVIRKIRDCDAAILYGLKLIDYYFDYKNAGSNVQDAACSVNIVFMRVAFLSFKKKSYFLV